MQGPERMLIVVESDGTPEGTRVTDGDGGGILCTGIALQIRVGEPTIGRMELIGEPHVKRVACEWCPVSEMEMWKARALAAEGRSGDADTKA